MKPADLFIGAVEFFSVIVPGSIATFLIWASADQSWPEYFHLSYLSSSDVPAIKGLAFILMAYVIGHVLFVLSSVLDPIYDVTYRRWKNDSITYFVSRAKAIQEEVDPNGSTYGEDMGILEWSVSYLLVNSAVSSQETKAKEGASKFFRSLGAVFIVVAILDLVNSNIPHALFSLSFAGVAVARYADLRLKYTRLVYSLAPQVSLIKNQG